MMFRLYAVLHNTNLETKKAKGKRIKFDEYTGRITNDSKEFEKILKNEEAKERIGFHSLSEFTRDGATYIYIDGELGNVSSWAEMDNIGVGFTFYLLRKIQYLTHGLWAVKDNNAYVRDGFLIVYPVDFTDVGTYKASLSAINSTATISKKTTSCFTDENIEKASLLLTNDLFSFHLKEEGKNTREFIDSKYATPEVFYKSKGSTRYIRAWTFVAMARSSHLLPLKIEKLSKNC